MSVFGQDYARAYDLLYREKDYTSECDMIEALLKEFGSPGPCKLVDLGCGTGNHCIALAERGYQVSGVDLSPSMLTQARAKAEAASVAAHTDFREGDVRYVRFSGETFDAAIMMFAVLGYQQSNQDVRDTLETVRGLVLPGATFIFDIWYGPGVLADKPGPRERVIERGDEKLIRRTDATLDEARHLCSVQFDLERWQAGQRVSQVKETHIMRYFFAAELTSFAAECGFELMTLRNSSDWKKPVADRNWNATGVMVAL